MTRPGHRCPVKNVRAEWTDIVLVCRKCAKKLKGGFGAAGDERFAKALRAALAMEPAGGRGPSPTADPPAMPAAQGEAHPRKKAKKAKGRRARIGVIEVGCFDICPKDALVTVTGSRPGTWRVIPRGMPMAEVVEVLGLGASPLSADPRAARRAGDAPPDGDL